MYIVFFYQVSDHSNDADVKFEQGLNESISQYCKVCPKGVQDIRKDAKSQHYSMYKQ